MIKWINGLSRQDYVIFTIVLMLGAFYIGRVIGVLLK